MAYLGSPSATKEIINKYSFAFQKKFGQNFLIDSNILESIVSAADITKDDFVLEIGPGIGTMTQYLCEAARQVVAVEIDKMLIPILKDTLSEYDNVEVINQDVLKLDIKALAQEKNNGKPIKVVANLPCLKARFLLKVLPLWYKRKLPTECRQVPVQKIMVLYLLRFSITQMLRCS